MYQGDSLRVDGAKVRRIAETISLVFGLTEFILCAFKLNVVKRGQKQLNSKLEI
jgi:hypothetical protein